MFQEEGLTSSPLQMFPKELKPEERGLYLIHLLLSCASHVASGSLENANAALDEISHLASPLGDTMQRIASYFSEALADRILRSWPGVHKAFHSTRAPPPSEEILVRKMFFDLLPFLKVAFAISNQAIVEAMEGEKTVHVIDLHAADPAQWRALIQDLSARPEGPPHLRITAVHPQREVLDRMARLLADEATKLDLPFHFHPVVMETLDLHQLKLKLELKTGEALAIASVMLLHTAENHSAFLSAMWGLSPKIVVVTEQDSDHNGKCMVERMSEALYFYAALFDCTESRLPRGSLERLKMEKMVFGEEIKNIVACEGVERRERHQRLHNWIQRLEVAGFLNVPISYYALLQANRLLQSYKCDGYKIRDENGSVVICWQDRPLYSVSAWRFHFRT